MTIPAGTLVPRDARDFGNYQLLAKLATGGMAEIFLARPTGSLIQHDVLVLKRILPHLAEDEHFVTMFRDEADLASKLLHKNVCQVMSFGQFAGTWFIAMEYLHGVPLSRMMTRLSKVGKMLDFRVVAGILVQACDGLHSAHEARDGNGHLMGVVHRDVSPPNIMVCGDGCVKLLDFGIAKARGANSRTRTGTVKGKNAYMSPEQILGKPLDRRSDVFALAVVMYEMLSIKRLFHRDSDFLTFKAITEEPIPDIRERRPDLPAAMRAALVQAMARDPNGRYESAQAFGNAIRAAVAPLGGPASPNDLARLLSSDFGDEMAARDEILKAADDPNAAPASSPTGQMKRYTPLQVPVRKTPPVPLQSPRSGELKAPAIKPPTAPPPLASDAAAVPSMMVTPPSTRIVTPPPAPPSPRGTEKLPSLATAPTPLHTPVLQLVPDLSASMPADNWVSHPDTDLLKAHRTRMALWVIGIGIALGLAGAAVYLLVVSGDDAGDSDLAATHPVAAPADAGVAAVVIHADAAPKNVADMTREQITALSKYGFYTLKASANPTQIYLDDTLVGKAPLDKVPIPPGPHKIRAVGPGGKTKELKITIIGGQYTDDGTITW